VPVIESEPTTVESRWNDTQGQNPIHFEEKQDESEVGSMRNEAATAYCK
jgi:hypothetical protein